MAKVIDLFCGIGGLTSGLIQSGLEVVAGIDIDKKCEFAYSVNNKSKFINKSITNVTASELNDLYGDDPIKILVGCAPCQPFSNHQKSKAKKINHKDWGLLYEFLRVVKEIEPTIVSMENVPTLINEVVFKEFVEGLENLGYFVNYRVHNTINFGMAQRRKRLLLLASKLGEIQFSNDTEECKTLRDIIGDLPEINAGETCISDRFHVSCNLSELNLKRIKSSKQGGTWEDWEKELLPDCYLKDSGSSYKSVYGRMEYDSIAPTLTTQFHSYGTGRFGHPTQDRAISIREGALLQSFPKDYIFLPDNEKVQISVLTRQIGNAVPPKLGIHIGKSIIQHLKHNNICLVQE